MLLIRLAEPDDAEALGEVMYDAIHNGSSLYTHKQRVAWLNAPPRGHLWETRLAAQDVWVAELAGELAGFLTLDEAGYIDLAFVCGDAQRQGVFRSLYSALETAARIRGHAQLRTHASLMAQPAFATQGFRVIGHEKSTRNGQTLDRAEMEKLL